MENNYTYQQLHAMVKDRVMVLPVVQGIKVFHGMSTGAFGETFYAVSLEVHLPNAGLILVNKAACETMEVAVRLAMEELEERVAQVQVKQLAPMPQAQSYQNSKAA